MYPRRGGSLSLTSLRGPSAPLCPWSVDTFNDIPIVCLKTLGDRKLGDPELVPHL